MLGYTIAEGLNTALTFINTFVTEFNFEAFGRAIYEGINGFISTFDFKLAAKTISNITHGLFTTFQTAIRGVKWEEVGIEIATFLQELEWGVFFEDVGTTVMDAFVASIKLAGGVLLGNTALYEYFKTGMNEIVSNINAMCGEFETGNTTEDGMALSKLENALDLYNEMYEIKEKNNGLSKQDIENGKKIEELMAKEGEILNLNLKDLQKYTEELVTNSKEHEKFLEKIQKKFDFKELGKNSREGFIEGVDGIEDESVGLFESMLNIIKEILGIHSPSTVFKAIGEFLIKGMLLGIKGEWSSLINYWKTVVTTWWNEDILPWFSADKWLEIGKNMKNGLYGGLKGIVLKIIDILNGIIGGFENMINTVIELTNTLITKLKDTVVGDLAIKAGLSIESLDKITLGRIKVPALANGAVIQGGKPFAAILGDQRFGQTNIETPLPTMVQAFKQALAENGGQYGGNYTFVAQLDSRTIFKETVTQDKMFRQSTGRSAFSY